MDLVSGLAATGNAITLVRAIKDAGAALDSATLKAKLAEVMNELSDAKLAQVELIEQNRQLVAEVDRLQKFEGDIANLHEVQGYYYQRTEAGSPCGWPACPTCLAREKSVIQLVQNGGIAETKCPRCGTEFQPVTCYLDDGRTAVQAEKEKRARQSAENNAKLARFNRGTWMSR